MGISLSFAFSSLQNAPVSYVKLHSCLGEGDGEGGGEIWLFYHKVGGKDLETGEASTGEHMLELAHLLETVQDHPSESWAFIQKCP